MQRSGGPQSPTGPEDDYLRLDRIYLPGDWMAEQGVTIGDLNADATSPSPRGHRPLSRRCDRLLEDARRLPGQLENRRLRMEASVIVRLAERLTALLREGDPVAGRVADEG